MDDGLLTSSYTLITTITPSSTMQYTVTQTDNNLVSGTKYRFITTATNDIGTSDSSNEARFACSDLPQ